MGDYTTLMARDGHEFQAWLAAAPGRRARGAVLVLQEIFGVNAHVRGVADGFAAEGYTTIAPCLFDRIRRGIELGYDAASLEEGRGYVAQLAPERTLLDIAAALAVTRHSGRAAAVGYCWGGTLALRAAARLPLACAVVYYGRLPADLDPLPRCPLMFHYGDEDRSIPPADVARVRDAFPQADIHTYAGAGHGFNCEQRAAWDPAAAALARSRTLGFIAHHLTGAAAGAPAAPGALAS